MKTLNKIKTFAVAAAMVTFGGAASASTIFADSVIDFEQGLCTDGGLGPVNANGCAIDRSDETNALGGSDGDFFSLGDGGYIVLGFSSGPFSNGEASVYEITTNRDSEHDEAVEVYSALAGVYTFRGVITNSIAESSVLVFGDFDSIALADVTYSHFGTTTSFDGFDVDAVGVSAVPLPAAGLMLLMGLGGLATMRRKKA